MQQIETGVRTLAGLLAAASFFFFAAAPAVAQVSSDEAKCRLTLAKSGGKYLKTIGKETARCHKGRNAGKVDALIDCNSKTDLESLSSKISGAGTKLSDKVGKACSAVPSVLSQFGRCPTPLETVDDGDATDGIDSLSELTSCLVAHADLLALGAAEEILGQPTPPLDSDLAKCHGTLAKGLAKQIDTIVKVQAKCQKTLDKTAGTLGFDCVSEDPKNKIAGTAQKLKDKILKACTGVPSSDPARQAATLASLDSCASTPAELADCAIDESAGPVGVGTSAMFWELPGICPGSGVYRVSPVITGTELDAGWTGIVHDMDPVLGYRALDFLVTCDADCNNCTSTEAQPTPEACRCSDDAAVVCADDGDCGGTCQCFYGPPTPFAGGGTPVCVMNEITGPIPALFPLTGAGAMVFDLPLRIRMHLGLEIVRPCPLCDGGICDGGERNGLACTTDASDATFGDVSYDCPPSNSSNISGGGLTTDIRYSTFSEAVPFAVPCSSPLAFLDCACGTCSTDSSIVCQSDADCAAAPTECSGASVECSSNADCASVDVGPCISGISRCLQDLSLICATNIDCAGVDAGDCTNVPVCGSGAGSQPNACSDLVCSADVETGEGYCAAGPVDFYCDGQLRSNGEGIVPCASNFDCDAVGPSCDGGDCGNCTLSKPRECFLNPIVAEGRPNQSLVGSGCLGTTSSGGVNAAIGLPGAYRVKQNFGSVTELTCADGVTPFIPPGGSSCP